MKNVIFVITLTALMTGCGFTKTKPEPEVKIVKEFVYVGVPKEFYTPLDIPKPIPREQYLNLTESEKEYELTIYSNTLLGRLAQYHLLQSKLKQWDTEQSLIFKNAPDPRSGGER